MRSNRDLFPDDGRLGSQRPKYKEGRSPEISRRDVVNLFRRTLPIRNRSVGAEVGLGARSHPLRDFSNYLQGFHIKFDT